MLWASRLSSGRARQLDACGKNQQLLVEPASSVSEVVSTDALTALSLSSSLATNERYKNTLGIVYEAQGNHDDAEKLFKRVLGIWEPQLGSESSDHPNN